MGLFDHTEESQQLQVDDTVRANMLEMGRWGKFLAIVGFISMGLMILMGLFMLTAMSKVTMPASEFGDAPMATGSAFGSMMGGAMFFIYIILAALYFYPTYALYKYSVLVKRGINTEDQFTFNKAFGYLRGCFKYLGILVLIMICIYAMFFIFGGVAALVAGALS